MKKYLLTLQLIMIVICCTLQPSAMGPGSAVNTCSNACAGNNVACKGTHANCGGVVTNERISTSSTVNAYKDRINWGSLETLKKEIGFDFIDLGKLETIKNYVITFPAVNTKKVIRCMPTNGNFKNQIIDILFVSFDLSNLPVFNYLQSPTFKLVHNDLNKLIKDGTPFRYVIKIYRRAGTEFDWVEIARNAIQTNTVPSSVGTSLKINPKAVVTIPEMEQRDGFGNIIKVDSMTIDCGAML